MNGLLLLVRPEGIHPSRSGLALSGALQARSRNLEANRRGSKGLSRQPLEAGEKGRPAHRSVRIPLSIQKAPLAAGLSFLKERDKIKAAVSNVDAVFGSRSSRAWMPVAQLTDGTPVPSLLRADGSGRVSTDRDVSLLCRNEVLTAVFPPVRAWGMDAK